MRLSMDCKATVNIGDYSRGGKTRGDNKANDHDMGCKENYTPFGIVNEDTGELHFTFPLFRESPWCVDFSPDGQTIGVGWNRGITLFNAAPRKDVQPDAAGP